MQVLVCNANGPVPAGKRNARAHLLSPHDPPSTGHHSPFQVIPKIWSVGSSCLFLIEFLGGVTLHRPKENYHHTHTHTHNCHGTLSISCFMFFSI